MDRELPDPVKAPPQILQPRHHRRSCPPHDRRKIERCCTSKSPARNTPADKTKARHEEVRGLCPPRSKRRDTRTKTRNENRRLPPRKEEQEEAEKKHEKNVENRQFRSEFSSFQRNLSGRTQGRQNAYGVQRGTKEKDGASAALNTDGNGDQRQKERNAVVRAHEPHVSVACLLARWLTTKTKRPEKRNGTDVRPSVQSRQQYPKALATRHICSTPTNS